MNDRRLFGNPALPIRWTGHAIERAIERFGSTAAVDVPEGLLAAVACNKQRGKRFRVRRGLVVFICERSAAAVFIVTVYRK